MKILINERLSEHKYKTPEGYLICTDAILARTGKQEYRRKEVFGDSCEDADDVIEIDRKEEEVFSPATLASFENKPITVEHPDVDVNSDNYKDYAVGFVRDVKRGVAEGQDVILGTLVITDRQTIEEIENGEHTDLSCGYDCDIADEDNPQQRNIRGNHVALCAQGRAGIARIVDSKVEDEIKERDIKVGNKFEDKAGNIYIIKNISYDDRISFEYRTKEGKLIFSNSFYMDRFLDKMKFIGARIVDSKVEDASKFYIITKYRGQAEICESLDKAEKLKNSSSSMFSGGKIYEVNSNINWYKQTEKSDGQGGVYSDLLSDVKKGVAIEVKDSIKDSLTRQERELCDYILDNCYDRGMTAEDLLRKMKVYYSEYANLARRKSNEVLEYFEDEIESGTYDSIKDEKPFSYSQVLQEIKIDTNNFTEEFEGRYGYEEEAMNAIKILKGKGYNVDYHTDDYRHETQYIVEASKTKQYDSVKDKDYGKYTYEITWTAEELRGDQITVVPANSEEEAKEKFKRMYPGMKNERVFKNIKQVEDSIKDTRNTRFASSNGYEAAGKKLAERIGLTREPEKVVKSLLSYYPNLSPFEIELAAQAYFYNQVGISSNKLWKEIEQSVKKNISSEDRNEWYGDSVKDSRKSKIEKIVTILNK